MTDAERELVDGIISQIDLRCDDATRVERLREWLIEELAWVDREEAEHARLMQLGDEESLRRARASEEECDRRMQALPAMVTAILRAPTGAA